MTFFRSGQNQRPQSCQYPERPRTPPGSTTIVQACETNRTYALPHSPPEPASGTPIDHTLPGKIDPAPIPHTLNNLPPIRRYPAPALPMPEQLPVLQ